MWVITCIYLQQVVETPHLERKQPTVPPSPPPDSPFFLPDWAVFLVVLFGFLLVLLIVWLVYSWANGLLSSGGAVALPLRIPAADEEEEAQVNTSESVPFAGGLDRHRGRVLRGTMLCLIALLCYAILCYYFYAMLWKYVLSMKR